MKNKTVVVIFLVLAICIAVNTVSAIDIEVKGSRTSLWTVYRMVGNLESEQAQGFIDIDPQLYCWIREARAHLAKASDINDSIRESILVGDNVDELVEAWYGEVDAAMVYEIENYIAAELAKAVDNRQLQENERIRLWTEAVLGTG